MTQYVQHISGKGEKWKLVGESNSFIWKAYGQGGVVHLPTSEYQICDSPEEWEDVTAQCVIGKASPESERGSINYKDTNDVIIDIFNQYQLNNYRVTKIDHLHNGPAFIIERKKS